MVRDHGYFKNIFKADKDAVDEMAGSYSDISVLDEDGYMTIKDRAKMLLNLEESGLVQ